MALELQYTRLTPAGRRIPLGGNVLPVATSATAPGTQPTTPSPDDTLEISLRSDAWAAVDIAASPDPTGSATSIVIVGPGAPQTIKGRKGLKVSTIGTAAPGAATGADLTVVRATAAEARDIAAQARADVAGVPDALAEKVDAAALGSTTLKATGSTVDRLLADWLRISAQIFRGEPENAVFKMEIDDRAGTANRLRVVAGTQSNGVTLTIAGPNEDAPFALIAPGKGSLIFGNGGGRIFELVDDLSGQFSYYRFSMRAAPLGGTPRLTSNGGAEFMVAPGLQSEFMVTSTLGTEHVVGAFQSFVDQPTMYPKMVADSSYARLVSHSKTLADVPLQLYARGAGFHLMTNAFGDIAKFSGIAGQNSLLLFTPGTDSANALITVSRTDAPITLAGNGEGPARVRRPQLAGIISSPFSGTAAPVAGGTTTLTTSINSNVLLRPAAAITGHTIALPANPPDGLQYTLTSTFAISGVTWAPASGDNVDNAVPTSIGRSGFTIHYEASTRYWYRKG